MPLDESFEKLPVEIITKSSVKSILTAKKENRLFIYAEYLNIFGI